MRKEREAETGELHNELMWVQGTVEPRLGRESRIGGGKEHERGTA